MAEVGTDDGEYDPEVFRLIFVMESLLMYCVCGEIATCKFGGLMEYVLALSMMMMESLLMCYVCGEIVATSLGSVTSLGISSFLPWIRPLYK
ncbi:hypothetical protein CGCF413_v010396 [Colletotrichum fructicola]|nr:hypothetical protein CGCF413_v010396 [Colletotrichum fructicola]